MADPIQPIQQPLSLVLQLNTPGDFPQIMGMQDPSNMPDILHFAWLIPLDLAKGKLLLTTVYDGDFDIYLDKFLDASHAQFDQLFPHLKDGPKTPCLENRQSFHDYVRKNNINPVPGTFFSAYPRMSVTAIQSC